MTSSGLLAQASSLLSGRSRISPPAPGDAVEDDGTQAARGCLTQVRGDRVVALALVTRNPEIRAIEQL